MSKYRVGVVGLVHGHIWGLLKEWNADPRAGLVAVAEADPQLLQQLCLRTQTLYFLQENVGEELISSPAGQ